MASILVLHLPSVRWRYVVPPTTRVVTAPTTLGAPARGYTVSNNDNPAFIAANIFPPASRSPIIHQTPELSNVEKKCPGEDGPITPNLSKLGTQSTEASSTRKGNVRVLSSSRVRASLEYLSPPFDPPTLALQPLTQTRGSSWEYYQPCWQRVSYFAEYAWLFTLSLMYDTTKWLGNCVLNETPRFISTPTVYYNSRLAQRVPWVTHLKTLNEWTFSFSILVQLINSRSYHKSTLKKEWHVAALVSTWDPKIVD